MDDRALLRILHGVEGLHVSDGCPYPSEVLRFTDLRRQKLGWSPFVGLKYGRTPEGNGETERAFDIVLDASRAQGMEVGKTYASSALSRVEGQIG
jgi:hypothetical protein